MMKLTNEYIGGPAITYGEVIPRNGYGLRFLSTCFDETLPGVDASILSSHDEGKPIARTKSGTAVFKNTPKALHVEYKPNQSSHGRDALHLVRAGDVRGHSIGVQILEFNRLPPAKPGDGPILEVTKAKILECSLVCWPADVTTSARITTGRMLREANGEKEPEDAELEEFRSWDRYSDQKSASQPSFQDDLKEMVDGYVNHLRKQPKEVQAEALRRWGVTPGVAIALSSGAKLERLTPDSGAKPGSDLQELDTFLAEHDRKRLQTELQDERFRWLHTEWGILRHEAFGGDLTERVQFRISDCGDAWGTCTQSGSPHYVTIHEPLMADPNDRRAARAVLLHEAIHAKLFDTIGAHDHDETFTAECNRIAKLMGLPEVPIHESCGWPHSHNHHVAESGRKLCMEAV